MWGPEEEIERHREPFRKCLLAQACWVLVASTPVAGPHAVEERGPERRLDVRAPPDEVTAKPCPAALPHPRLRPFIGLFFLPTHVHFS